MKKTRLNHVKHDPAVGPFDKGTNKAKRNFFKSHFFNEAQISNIFPRLVS